MTTADPLIDVAGPGKRYGERNVVRDVSLRLPAGHLVGLVGANGGGKTTTLRMFAGLVPLDAGSGHVLDADIRGSRANRRAAIGYMPQRLSLYPELTVAENPRFRADVYGLPDPREVRAAIVRWGLERVVSTRFERLSGGWGRRVQFAATMLHAPRLLLLDEPTAGLDVVTRNDIWRWLADLAAQGCAVVISTHDLTEAERCPSILYYDDGIVRGPMPPTRLIELSGAATLEHAVAQLTRRGW